MIANAVLNHLDQKLDEKGYRFVRYADDFVVMCKTRTQAESALDFTKSVIEGELKLELSKEKTNISGPGERFNFLVGFHISNYGVKMREKSKEKFKMKVRMLTKQSHNLDKRVVEKLTQVIRGTMNYFVTQFTTRQPFVSLDSWI